jgi:hypothetical protein
LPLVVPAITSVWSLTFKEVEECKDMGCLL